MNAKQIGLIITFAAIAIALNAIKIPAFFWPGNFFTLSDIPVVIAFILFGVRIGILVGFFNLLGQLLFFLISPVYVVAYPMGFVATLLMLFGVYLGSNFMGRKKQPIEIGWKRPTFILTIFAFLFRGLIMPLIDFQIFYRTLIPIFTGNTIPLSYVVGLLPVFVLFNSISAFYTVPVAYTVSRKIGKFMKIELALFKTSEK
jgi:uncharacterized membrane protein